MYTPDNKKLLLFGEALGKQEKPQQSVQRHKVIQTDNATKRQWICLSKCKAIQIM